MDGQGAFIPGEDTDNENEKDKIKNREDESCAGTSLDWGTSIPANGITHVGSKNVNKPEVSGIDP